MRVFGILLLACAFASAQTPVGSTATTDAANLRTQAIDAAGGATALSAIKDYTAAGTITFVEGEKQTSGAVSIKSRGKYFLRFDALLSEGQRSWVVRGPSGQAKLGDAKAARLSSEVALSLRNYALPVAVLARAPDADLGLLQKEGDATNLRRLTAVSDPHQRSQQTKPTEYQLDSQSGRILRVATEVRSRPGVAPILQEFVYSDYRAVEGVLFPFAIEEWNRGQIISRIQLEKISINTGLTAVDFDLE